MLAFWTDSTRIGTFMFANDVSGRNFAALIPGVSGGHHEISHHQNDGRTRSSEYKKINRWHVEQFAWLMDKMRSIKEGDGTLLDNSMVLFGSSMSDGNRHDPANLPILLGGRGRRHDPLRPARRQPRRHAAVQSLRLDARRAWASRCRASATAPANWPRWRVRTNYNGKPFDYTRRGIAWPAVYGR